MWGCLGEKERKEECWISSRQEGKCLGHCTRHTVGNVMVETLVDVGGTRIKGEEGGGGELGESEGGLGRREGGR